MNTKQDQVLEPDRIPGRSDGATDSDADSHLHVTVLVTSAERTIAALSAARNLTAGLGLRLTLLAIEEVPFRVPLDKPLVSLDFKQVQLQTFLAKSGIEQEDVNVSRLLVPRSQRRVAACASPSLCRRARRRKKLVVLR